MSLDPNPGALRMRVFAPAKLAAGRPLVVVLHGCRQDAASFATDAGWIAVARRFRLALLLPEQTYENNKGRCFNWFRPEDVKRGSGEIMSIRQMIRHATQRFGSDPKQIFVTGFSAGGGMAAALMAAYPAVFAAGGIVAGMPAGCATTQMGAVLHMRHADVFRTRLALANDVRKVTRATSRKVWPRLSIWQGALDRTVDRANAEAFAAQWSELHGFGPIPTSDITTPGVRRRIWSRPDLPPSVDVWTLKHQGHGFPVDPHTPDSGRFGPWLADAGLSAAHLITAFWGLDRPSL